MNIRWYKRSFSPFNPMNIPFNRHEISGCSDKSRRRGGKVGENRTSEEDSDWICSKWNGNGEASRLPRSIAGIFHSSGQGLSVLSVCAGIVVFCFPNVTNGTVFFVFRNVSLLNLNTYLQQLRTLPGWSYLKMTSAEELWQLWNMAMEIIGKSNDQCTSPTFMGHCPLCEFTGG